MKKLFAVLSLMLLTGCDVKLFVEVPKVEDKEVTAEGDMQVGLANPASVNCGEKGGTLEIKTDEEGGQYGMCKFANGKECEEWAFFRGECQAELTVGEQACLDKGGEVENDFCILEDGMMCGINATEVECPDVTSLKAVPESIFDLQEGLVVDGMTVAEVRAFDENLPIGEYNFVLVLTGEKNAEGVLEKNEDEFLGEMWSFTANEDLFPSLSVLPEFKNKTAFVEGEKEWEAGEQEVVITQYTVTLSETDTPSPTVVLQ